MPVLLDTSYAIPKKDSALADLHVSIGSSVRSARSHKASAPDSMTKRQLGPHATPQAVDLRPLEEHLTQKTSAQVWGPLAIQAKLSRNVVWGIDLTRLVAREVRDGLEVVGLTVQTLQN